MKKATYSLLFFVAALAVPSLALASDGDAEAGKYLVGSWAVLAGGLTIALAAAAGAFGQAWAASNALSGIARNPDASGKIFTPMILALALIESLVIYALVIAFMIVGKAP
jgi:F-type H+-transporting ATPase subunit c